jgi:hypothetical protein
LINFPLQAEVEYLSRRHWLAQFEYFSVGSQKILYFLICRDAIRRESGPREMVRFEGDWQFDS